MRVIQVLDALDFGDGVSNDVINLHGMLTRMGIKNKIYSMWRNEKVAGYTSNIERYKACADDLVLYHFSGESQILEQVMHYPCRRILRYHNVTPPEFFLPDNVQAYQHCKEGLDQINKNIHCFDGFCADSPFNALNLISYGADSQTVDVLPVVFDFDKIQQVQLNKDLLRSLQADVPYILFVGRVAPNKCFEDILCAFEAYRLNYGQRVKLYLVGNDAQNPSYTDMLMQKLEDMSVRDDVIFTGKVDVQDLYTYYYAASVFLCMSEHEGFCIPLLEAQYFDVPVIAYASCAVPDTLGKGGVLLYKKDTALIAALLNRMLWDDTLRVAVQKNQKQNIAQYQQSAVKERLSELLEKWGGIVR